MPDYFVSCRLVVTFWVKAALGSWKLGRGDTSKGRGRGHAAITAKRSIGGKRAFAAIAEPQPQKE
ncbi:hypothetical protein K3729_05810 [Rhodobacteraceae bacterium S2214]|nr:hypothetical protein K3729_05810 [Rhodobacteraceae bacterium S2214]